MLSLLREEFSLRSVHFVEESTKTTYPIIWDEGEFIIPPAGVGAKHWQPGMNRQHQDSWIFQLLEETVLPQLDFLFNPKS